MLCNICVLFVLWRLFFMCQEINRLQDKEQEIRLTSLFYTKVFLQQYYVTFSEAK